MFRLYLNLLEAMRVVSKGTEVNDVIKTNHVYDIRKGDSKERSYSISNEEFINILKRMKLDKKLQNKYYIVTYKNENDKYDNVVFVVDDKTIRFVTVIQQNRNNPNYKSKEGDIQVLLESLLKNIEFILVD